MNRLILAVTAIGVSALAVYAVTTSEDGDEIPEASITQHSADPTPVLVALPQAVNATKAMPTDFPSLAREIQRELKRVGCYGGEINGRWTPATRAAMKAFVDDANARLPVDTPDQVLLSLVQGERGTACAVTEVATGSATVTGSIERKSIAAAETSRAEAATSISEPVTSEPTPVVRAPDVSPAPQSEPAAPVETAALDDTASSATESGAIVTPPVVTQSKPRHTARYPKNRPPKIVRSLVRSIKRGLSSFGF